MSHRAERAVIYAAPAPTGPAAGTPAHPAFKTISHLCAWLGQRRLVNRFSCRTGVALVVAVLAVTGCGDNNVIGPANQLEVTNATDDFQWQVTALENVAQTLEYTWTNTGTQANVNQASTVTAGSATVTILDADGTQVYSRSLADNGTFETTSGTPGQWTIMVRLSDVDGTLNFRVQKRA
jgi:hypothetical protein